MSLHKSLVSKAALKRHRSVLSRAERVKRMMDEEAWQEGRSVFGLPKIRVHRVKAGGKHKKAEKPAAGAEGAAPAEAAAAEPKAEAAPAGKKK